MTSSSNDTPESIEIIPPTLMLLGQNSIAYIHDKTIIDAIIARLPPEVAKQYDVESFVIVKAPEVVGIVISICGLNEEAELCNLIIRSFEEVVVEYEWECYIPPPPVTEMKTVPSWPIEFRYPCEILRMYFSD